MDPAISDTKCPRCGGPVTYNGNYYCLNAIKKCGWALSCRTKKEREWAVEAYVHLMNDRKEAHKILPQALNPDYWKET